MKTLRLTRTVTALLICLALASRAAAMAPTEMVPGTGVPAGDQRKSLTQFLRKYGWDASEFAWSLSYTSDDEAFWSLQDRKLVEKENRVSVESGLSGFSFGQSGLSFYRAEWNCEIHKAPFDSSVRNALTFVFDTQRQNRLMGAWIVPDHMRYHFGTNIYDPVVEVLPFSVGPDGVTKAIQKHYDEDEAKPIDKTAALDFPVNSELIRSASMTKELLDVYRKSGWKTEPFRFYSASVYDLNAEEQIKVIYAAVEGGFTQMKYTRNVSGFAFSEHAYKVAPYETRYYVDFCAVLDLDKSMVSGMTIKYLFLIVKPGVPNADGKLDRFFYPYDAKPSVIAADMKAYFKAHGAA